MKAMIQMLGAALLLLLGTAVRDPFVGEEESIYE